MTGTGPLAGTLSRYRPSSPEEAADLDRVRELLATGGDPWSRATPLHVTASAMIVDPATRRVLLRWHARQQAWLQVGGHADPGENDPVQIVLREGREETGLADLALWPGSSLVHLVIVPVTAGGHEPAHQHADLRYVLRTRTPQAARPENPSAPLRWLPVEQALETTTEANVRETLTRVEHLLRDAPAGAG
ncbi:NUDIX domain-containing protein [Sphaerisporangium album]|uniref:NUDIX domain-containing protein n=1 Tax=Sphaerisporangium album TaxID=509200 RepID=A0A367F975_9ACTN|nr:NUDIX domain-containing protein [Sphaerisporangium album]